MFNCRAVEHSSCNVLPLRRLQCAKFSTYAFRLKQTCQIHDFVGYNENAVKWQIWIGLLIHLLLRFMKHISKWGLSFSRLAGIVRSAIWVRRDLLEILAFYGIAGPCNRPVIAQKNQYVQGFLPFTNLPYGTA